MMIILTPFRFLERNGLWSCRPGTDPSVFAFIMHSVYSSILGVFNCCLITALNRIKKAGLR